MRHARRLAFLALLAITPASAQGVTDIGTATRPFSMPTNGTGGNCINELTREPSPCAAPAATCPADKPIKRFTTRYPVTVTCTLLACSPRLKCPADSDRCYSVVEDCNKCTPHPVEEMICLSQDEFEKASR